MARRALIVIVGLLALVFAASVVCPPVRERAALPEETVGRADTLPEAAGLDAQADAADGGRADLDSPALPSAGSGRLEVRVVDDQGAPVAGAHVWLAPAAAEEEDGFFPQAVSDAEGLARPLWEEPGEHRLRGAADGHLAAERLVALPPAADAPPAELVLARGARVGGEVRDLAGGLVLHGEILLRAPALGEERVVRAQGQRGFDSGPLPAGDWEVAWRRHAHAELDPRLRYRAPLGPGQRLDLRFTLDEGGPAREGARVGVAPYAR